MKNYSENISLTECKKGIEVLADFVQKSNIFPQKNPVDYSQIYFELQFNKRRPESSKDANEFHIIIGLQYL